MKYAIEFFKILFGGIAVLAVGALGIFLCYLPALLPFAFGIALVGFYLFLFIAFMAVVSVKAREQRAADSKFLCDWMEKFDDEA